MSSEIRTVPTSFVSGSTLLGCTFVAMKLMGYVSWSWVWVTSPFWLPFCAVIALLTVIWIPIVVALFLDNRK